MAPRRARNHPAAIRHERLPNVFDDHRGLDVAVSDAADEAMKSLDAATKNELPALVTGPVDDIAADPLTGAPAPIVVALDRQALEAGRPARKALR